MWVYIKEIINLSTHPAAAKKSAQIHFQANIINPGMSVQERTYKNVNVHGTLKLENRNWKFGLHAL